MGIKQKIGLVVEGGGMKCAYNAGILDAFLDNQISFDYCIGVSGGAGNVASFVAKQRGRNLRFFTDYIHSSKYFGMKSFLKTGNLFGLQYIYGELTNSTGIDPLDFSTIMENPTQYQVVVTNALTGQAEYFSKEDMKQDDYRLIMASSAIPVNHAFKEGCDKLVVILSKQRDYVRKPQKMRFIYSRACHQYPEIIEAINERHITYQKNLKEVFDREKAGKVFVFAPTKKYKVGTYSINENVERQLYELGMADFLAQQEALKSFLNKDV